MRRILLIASFLSACSVDLSRLRPYNDPTDAPPEKRDLSLRDAATHLDTEPNYDTPDSTPDIHADTQINPSLHDVAPHPDMGTNYDAPDSTPDLTPKLPVGSNCSDSSQCTTSFCTNSVCCTVTLCVDTCIPDGITTCAPYSGWTCAPYGTCRGY